MNETPAALSDELRPDELRPDELRPDELGGTYGGAAIDVAVAAARGASAKTLEETVVLDVGDLLGITDYFVLTAGRNIRQVRAIVDEVAKAVREAGGTSMRRVEGLAEAQWVLIDYGSFVVHVFDIEARERFGLERLWADASRVEWEPALAGGVTT